MLLCHFRVLMFLATLMIVAVAVVPAFAYAPAADAAKKKEKEQPSEEAVLSAKTVVHADVPYGKDEKQRLDIYAPRSAKDAPVVVFFHRGEWTKGDKSEAGYKPKFLNDNGVVFVAANYRLSPAVKHPAHINDVATAVRWVYDHAAEFGGSPHKIVVMGHSAGCHLVTLLALDPRYLAAVKLRPSDLRGVVAWSGGAYDLVAKVKAGGMYGPYIKQAFGDSEAAWRDASPINHVGDANSLLKKGTGSEPTRANTTKDRGREVPVPLFQQAAKPLPPFLFISIEPGKDSTLAARKLAGLIRDAGGQASVYLIEGRTHRSANALIGAPGDTTGALLLDFVRQSTK